METVQKIIAALSPYLPILGWVSLAMFVLSIAIVPMLVARIPANYFVDDKLTPSSTKMTSIHYSLLWIVRNIAGLLLIISGIAMLVLPGQGLLTIIMGLFVADFPGKQKLERKLVALPAVYHSINWIRERKGVEHLTQPSSE